MEDKSNHKLALLSVLLASILGGGLPVFVKIGLREIPPFTFTFLRFFIASLFILPLVIKKLKNLNKDIWKIVLLSLLSTANVTLFAFGVKLTTATVSQLLYTTLPITAAILSYFFLRERFTFKKIIGMFLGFMGVILIILLPIINQGTSLQGNLLGNILILLGVVLFSFYSVFSKIYQQKLKITPIILTIIFTITTTLVLFIFAIQEYLSDPAWIWHVSNNALLSLLYASLFGGAVFYLLYQYAIKHGTPIIASLTMFIQPVTTFAWAFVLLNERLTIGVFIGGLLTLVGAYIVTLNKS